MHISLINHSFTNAANRITAIHLKYISSKVD